MRKARHRHLRESGRVCECLSALHPQLGLTPACEFVAHLPWKRAELSCEAPQEPGKPGRQAGLEQANVEWLDHNPGSHNSPTPKLDAHAARKIDNDWRRRELRHRTACCQTDHI